MYSVIPFQKELTIDKALYIQIRFFVVLWYVIKTFIDSKNDDRFVCKIQKKGVNSIISTYLCIYINEKLQVQSKNKYK